MKTLLYATTNEYKLQTAIAALGSHDIILKRLPIDVPEVMEIQADSQEAVAINKTIHLAYRD